MKVAKNDVITWRDGGEFFAPIFRSGTVTDVSKLTAGVVSAEGSRSGHIYEVQVRAIEYVRRADA
jgi:hypothetical protein